jgi:catechol 2,3-dioxygenase-like lactoylglutathione lyase family enzyme
MISLGMVPIFVSDQQRALEFYRDKLGFEVVMDDPYSGYRWITVAPVKSGPQLILYHPGMYPGGDAKLRSRVGSWTGIVFFTDDIHGDYQKLSQHGVHFDDPPSEQSWGGWLASFTDPDGNSFHLGTSY